MWALPLSVMSHQLRFDAYHLVAQIRVRSDTRLNQVEVVDEEAAETADAHLSVINFIIITLIDFCNHIFSLKPPLLKHLWIGAELLDSLGVRQRIEIGLERG